MYLSLFQIQNLCQFCAKRWFFQKDIFKAFPFMSRTHFQGLLVLFMKKKSSFNFELIYLKCWNKIILRKLPFCPELTQILDLEETETHYGNSLIMALQMKVYNRKKFQIPCTGSKVHKCYFRNCQFDTFDLVHWIWIFFWPNTFIWSAMNVGLYECAIMKLFPYVSQSLPNPEFVSIVDKKVISLKGHPYSIFILDS